MKQLLFALMAVISIQAQAQTVVDIGPILKSTMSAKEKAVKIVIEAEKIVHPVSFMHASDLFKKALSLDPKNKEAKFYVLAIDAFLQLRNLHARVAPLMAQMTTSQQMKYNEFKSEAASQSLLQFLSNAPAEIYKESQLQMVLLDVMNSLERFRQYLIANQEQQLTLRMGRLNEFGTKKANKCGFVVLKAGEKFQLDKCVTENHRQMNMNIADNLMLRNSVAGFQVALILATSYHFDGFVRTMEQGKSLKLSPAKIIERLRKIEKLGKLKNDKLMKTVPKLAADVAVSVRWALKHQSVVCKGGESSESNRIDYMYNKGLCFEPKEAEDYENFSKGQPVKVVTQAWDANGQTFTEETVNYGILFSSPIQDLKQLLPDKFNRCGEPIGFSDRKVLGVFPEGDSAKQFKTSLPYFFLGLNNWGRRESTCKMR